MLDKTTPSLSQIAASFLVKKHWETLYKFFSRGTSLLKSHDFLKDGIMEILGLTEKTITHNALELLYDIIKAQCIDIDRIDHCFEQDQLLWGVQYAYQYSFYRIDTNKTIAAAINHNYKLMPELLSNFCIVAAKFGLLAELEMLLNEYPEKHLEMIEANGFDVFQSAVEEGQLPVLKFLWDRTPDHMKQDMLETDGYSPFFSAIVYDRLDAVVFLWNIASDIQKEDIFQIFIKSSITEFIEDVDSSSAEFYSKFIEFLWDNITDIQKQQLLEKIINDCFGRTINEGIYNKCHCCFTGIPFVWDKVCEIQKQKLLDKFINKGACLAVINGNMHIIDFFWEKLDDGQRQLVLQKLVDEIIALPLGKRLHTNAIPFLWDKLSTEKKELLLAHQDYSLLYDAAKNASISTLITLWNSLSHTLKTGILESEAFKVFDILVINERLDAFKFLWGYTSLEQKEHILQQFLEWNNIHLPSMFMFQLKKIITTLEEEAPRELHPLLQKLKMHCGSTLDLATYDHRWHLKKLSENFEKSTEGEAIRSGKAMAQENEGLNFQTLLQHTGMFADSRNSLSYPPTTPEINEYINIRKSTLARKAETEPDEQPDSKRPRLR